VIFDGKAWPKQLDKENVANQQNNIATNRAFIIKPKISLYKLNDSKLLAKVIYI